MKFILSIFKSFYYAFAGIVHCIKNERNFRVHLVAAVLVIGFGVLYGLTGMEWAVIAITIGAVLSCEMINTAIEATVDRTGTHRDDKGRIAKDTAAGATLIFALAAVAVAVAIFSDLTRLIPAVTSLFTTWRCLIFVVYVIVSVLFIKGKNKS